LSQFLVVNLYYKRAYFKTTSDPSIPIFKVEVSRSSEHNKIFALDQKHE